MSLSIRYAHSEGHTDLCYDNTGKYLITCGTDGDIRIWNGYDDDDPKSHHIGEYVSAVSFQKNMLYLSCDKYSVAAYTFPDMEFDGIIAQFSTTVHSIACSQNGKYVASGGGDFIVKIYNTVEKSLVALREHSGPILGVAFDPHLKFLASSSCDGTVYIWNFLEQECVKKLHLLKKTNDFCGAESLCHMDWSPDGELLAIPVKKEIQFYKREIWSCCSILSDDFISMDLSIVTFTTSGLYIAAAGIGGQMLVWEVKENVCISKKSHEKKLSVCSLVWHPAKEELAFCDVEGQLGIYENVLIAEKNKVPQKEEVLNFEHFESAFDEDDDNAFDIGAIKATLEPKIFGDNNAEEDNESIKSEVTLPKVQPIQIVKPPVQSAFQPTSTPINLEHRFMLWNSVGIVRCYNTEEENSIDVEFHDVNIYHPLHINNTRNHSMAALSMEALLLSCSKIADISSKLECLHFGTWDSNKEWIIEMPQEEDIEAIALGDGWAVAITDKNYVRIFTISGVQCEVLLIPGPVVCCSALNNQLVIAYHRGLGIDNSQCLGLMLLNIKIGKTALVKDFPLPLSAKAFLSWLGFTDEGRPCIADSDGIISILNSECGIKWTPIANSSAQTKGKSDTYFVLGLSEIQQEIRCIFCKGSKYPSLLPKPIISILPFSLPFCEMTSDKGRFEEENKRHSLSHRCLKYLMDQGYDVASECISIEKKWMDILLKMFALATRTEREFRALDIAELMPNPQTIQGAIRYATQRRCIALAERLGEVLNKKLSEPDLNQEDELFLDEENVSRQIDFKKNIKLSISHHEDETLLQPKPLSSVRSNIVNFESKDGENDTIGNKASSFPSNKSLFSNLSPVANPFKASVRQKLLESKVAQVGLDDILSDNKHSTMKETVQEKNTKQSEQFISSKQKLRRKIKEPSKSAEQKSGFKFFLNKNKSELKAEHPDLSEQKIVQMAMKLYKELTPAGKEEYSKMSSEEACTGSSSNDGRKSETELEVGVANSTEKQKRPFESLEQNILEEANSKEQVKKPKLSATKLSQYAFFKKPK